MASMRGAARQSYEDKLGRMGLVSGDGEGEKVRTASMDEDVGLGHTGAKSNGSLGKAQGKYADGFETASESETAPRRRLDRSTYKKGGRVKGSTTVNVIVAPQGQPAAPPEPMMPPPPPMPPPGLGAGAGGPPPLPGVPMGRKHGGRVPHLTAGAGAGGGKGRLAKIKSYGDNAKA